MKVGYMQNGVPLTIIMLLDWHQHAHVTVRNQVKQADSLGLLHLCPAD